MKFHIMKNPVASYRVLRLPINWWYGGAAVTVAVVYLLLYHYLPAPHWLSTPPKTTPTVLHTPIRTTVFTEWRDHSAIYLEQTQLKSYDILTGQTATLAELPESASPPLSVQSVHNGFLVLYPHRLVRLANNTATVVLDSRDGEFHQLLKASENQLLVVAHSNNPLETRIMVIPSGQETSVTPYTLEGEVEITDCLVQADKIYLTARNAAASVSQPYGLVVELNLQSHDSPVKVLAQREDIHDIRFGQEQHLYYLSEEEAGILTVSESSWSIENQRELLRGQLALVSGELYYNFQTRRVGLLAQAGVESEGKSEITVSYFFQPWRIQLNGQLHTVVPYTEEENQTVSILVL